jgi:hypothetical protein
MIRVSISMMTLDDLGLVVGDTDGLAVGERSTIANTTTSKKN